MKEYKIKILSTLLVSGLTLASIIYAWSPSLTTYIPIEQQYDFSEEQAKIIHDTVLSRNQKQWNGLETSSIIILINLLVTILIIWCQKPRESKNT